MKETNNLDQLKDIQRLQQEIDALTSLCEQKTKENENLSKRLNDMEWMLKPKQTASIDFVPDYGDLSDLNEDGLIRKSIKKKQLQDIVSEYLDLLETSAAIYEKNGDYALGIFSSGWCRMMDAASRRLCNTGDNREALESGKWLCHDSCWKDASLKAMTEGKPIEVACNGGINLYTVPVRAQKQIIGAINFGFGSPPKEDEELKKLSKKYKIPLNELRKQANDYTDRPGFVIDYAKQRIEKSAQYLGYLVERKLEADSIEEIKERHRTTFNSIGDGVITTDKEGRITNMNPAAESYCGWTIEDAVNKPLSEVFRIVNAKTRKTVVDPVKQVMKSKKVVGLANHTVLISKSGKEYQIADTAAPIKNRDGEITGVVLVFSDVTREYSMREKLRQSEERLNYAMMVKNEGMWDWNIITHTVFFDDRYYTMAGYEPNEFPQTFEGWAERVHPDDLDAAQAALKAYQGGASEKYDLEFRFLKKDGEWMWIQTKGKIIERDAKGKPARMIGTHTDITERKLAETALLRTQKTVDKSPLSVFWISPGGKFIYVNETAAKKLEYSREELLSMHVWDVDPNYPREKRKEVFKQYRETGELSFESAHRRSDGKMLPVKINSYYLAFEGQEMEIAEVEDITERKKHEEQLLLQTEILDQIGDHVSVTDLNGKIIYANKAECNSIGLTKDQIIGKSIEIFGEDKAQGSTQQEILETTLKTGAWRGEVINYDKEGNLSRILDCRTTLLTDSNNNPKGLIGVSSDIAERKRAEEALRKSEEQHRRLFETMSQGVIYQAADGTIISVNPAAERMLGLSWDQMRGKTSMDPRWKMITEDGEKVPGSDHPAMITFKTGEKVGPVTRGIYIPEKDEYVWLSITATPLFRPGEEKPFQSYAVFDDITYKKHHEDELKKQQQLIHTILNKLPIGIAINTLESEPKVELVNENFAQIYGVETTDLPTVGSFWEAVYEDEAFREEIKNRVLSDIKSGDPKRMQWQDIPITKNGKLVKYVSSQNILLEEHGFMISTVMDTTERKLAEIDIQKSKEQLLTILNGINAFVYIADMDTHELLFINEAGLKVWGRDIEGQKCYNALQGFEKPCSFCSNEKLVDENGQPTGGYEWEFQNSVNNRWYALRDSAIYWEDGRLVRLEVAIDITEQKLAQQKIQESEDRFQKMLALIPDMISIHDKDFNIVYSNWKGFAAVDEAKRKLYTKCYKTYRDMDDVCPDCKAKEVLKTKKAFQTEAELPGGTWIDLRVIPVLDENGEMELFVEWVRDITDQKQTLKRQQILYQIANEIVVNFNLRDLIIAVEKHLSQLVDTSNYYVALYDEETAMLSAPFEKDEKDHVDTWLADESVTGLVINKKQSLLLRKPEIIQLIESGTISQTGSICEAWLGVPIFSKDKTVGAIVVQSYHNNDAFDDDSIEILEYVSNQISLALERTKAFEDLVQAKNNAEESQARFIALHNASFGGIMIHDKGKIIDCNHGLSAITGYSKEELMGMDGLMLLTEDSRHLAMHHIKTGSEKPYEAKGIRKNGEEYDLRIQAKNIPYKGKQIRAAEFRDITEDKKREQEFILAKEKAEESDRLKSAFLANMSHEIRTPMNGILGFSELLKEPELSDEKQQLYLEMIETSGKRMLNIINDIVDISRIEAGAMDVNLTASNINEHLDYIYTFFRAQVEEKGMTLELPEVLPAEQAMVVTDREKLFAVLTNLVKNAIKYSHKGTIRFGCTRKGSYLEFFVKDTGIGIPKDRQHAIFERFIQADIEDKEARQGAGLGLAISRAYVEMLGGEIWVESEEGKGSAFYFTVPIESMQEETRAEERNNSMLPEVVQTKKLKILIVEDDEMSSLVLIEYVKAFSKEILQAFDGKEAVEICRQHPDLDLILMDIKMPVMDGDKAAREIRGFNKDVVIIAQTAQALAGDKAKIMEAGFNDYITKPIDITALLKCIDLHVGRVE
ncbi:MAG: PAS domain S-box protein [Bacteroidales bacterium]|nr:PAS domain S-box protein [Bacteroidales bacterium]